MRSVLYTQRMEPITTLELPIALHEFKFTNIPYRVWVPEKLLHTPPRDGIIPSDIGIRTVMIYTKRFIHEGVTYPLFITNDEELALLLKSEPLPGQVKDFQNQYRRGIADGIVKAIKSFGG